MRWLIASRIEFHDCHKADFSTDLHGQAPRPLTCLPGHDAGAALSGHGRQQEVLAHHCITHPPRAGASKGAAQADLHVSKAYIYALCMSGLCEACGLMLERVFRVPKVPWRRVELLLPCSASRALPTKTSKPGRLTVVVGVGEEQLVVAPR